MSDTPLHDLWVQSEPPRWWLSRTAVVVFSCAVVQAACIVAAVLS